MAQQLKNKIDHKTAKIGIIGMGYVGLPLMHSVCSAGFRVTGFDIDPKKTELLNNGKSYLDTVPDDIITSHRNASLFKASHDFSEFSNMDIIIICVPTPLDEHREPDLSYVEKTIEEIAKTLRSKQLIILESTTYPGTMDDVVIPILERNSTLKASEDFYTAFSPEREDPGNPNFETSTIPKVVGADTDHERDLAVSFYAQCVKQVVPVSSNAVAEAVKITENIFRAVNIALANELKIIYDRMGIDIWDVIDAAKTKPFGYMPFYPGPGLGGHCIPIDPFYLTWKARELDTPTRFIELAGEINQAMPQHVAEKTIDALNARKKALNGAKVLILGVAYKKNINDQRESPAFPIMKILQSKGAELSFYDPHIKTVGKMRHFDEFAGMESASDAVHTASEADAVLLLTDHDDIDYQGIVEAAALIIDTRNAFMARNIKSNKIVKA